MVSINNRFGNYNVQVGQIKKQTSLEKTDELVEWCCVNYQNLMKHRICATKRVAETMKKILVDIHKDLQPEDSEESIKNLYDSKISTLLEGDEGGYQHIGAMLAVGAIDVVIMFLTPTYNQDIQSIIRLASLYDKPIAINKATANLVITTL